MIKQTFKSMLDHRDEVIVLITALMIPLVTLPSMIA
jgi:hypothetical protein